MAGGWRIGKIAGADITVRSSLLFMGIVLVIVFAPQFEQLHAGPNPYLISLVFVLSVYVSVFLHEVAHLLAARWFGMPVSSIDLHLLGGETHIEREADHPWQEFTISVVGPLCSAIIGLAAFWLAEIATGTTYSILWSLGFINILVAAFNLMPGLPLDGGRVLRSIIWGLTGSEAKGVRIAGRIGRIAGVGLVALAVAVLLGEGSLALGRALLILAVALFLWQGATAALNHGVLQARIGSISATGLMEPVTPPYGAKPIGAGLSGRSLLTAMAENPAEAYALVDHEGRVVGTLFASAVDRAYRESR